jgi:predicted RNA-binding protein with RPS1 domain
MKCGHVLLKDTRGNIYLGIKLSIDESKARKKRNYNNWKRRNPDKYQKHLEYVRRWKRKNKDRISAYRKQYWQDNRE